MKKQDVIELAKASGLIGKDYDPEVWDRELMIFAKMIEDRILSEQDESVK